MSTPIDFNGGLRMCDEQGRTVGVVLGNQAFEKLTAEHARLREELERLRARLREAEENGKRLEAEKAAIAAERDGYLKSLHYFTRKDFTFTAEEIADLDKNGVEFTKEFIDELERDLRERGNRP